MNVIGVDIGGTNIETGLINSKGIILKKISVKTEGSKGKKVVMGNIIKAIKAVKTKNVSGIGIGAPGPLDIKKGTLGKVLNIPLANVQIKKIIRNKFKVPVFLDNDANCFTLGESIFGAGKKKENVVGLTIGSGVGGGFVINKKIYHGRNNAGELGHITIKHDGPKSVCGNNGCIESYVNKEAIKRYAKGLAKSPEELFNLAVKRNKKALSIWRDVGKYLGTGIANIVNALDPDIVVIGGNISKAWRFFDKSLKKELNKRALFTPCNVVRSKLGEKAAILGAANLVLQNSKFKKIYKQC